MVLDHVAGRADAVVVAGPATKADVLGHGDLHVVDVVGVPDRLEQLVGEAQRQDVLHGLLAEVVVDAEHRLLGEDVVDDLVELARALQVVRERLIDHHPAPNEACFAGISRSCLAGIKNELCGGRRLGGIEGVIGVTVVIGAARSLIHGATRRIAGYSRRGIRAIVRGRTAVERGAETEALRAGGGESADPGIGGSRASDAVQR